MPATTSLLEREEGEKGSKTEGKKWRGVQNTLRGWRSRVDEEGDMPGSFSRFPLLDSYFFVSFSSFSTTQERRGGGGGMQQVPPSFWIGNDTRNEVWTGRSEEKDQSGMQHSEEDELAKDGEGVEGGSPPRPPRQVEVCEREEACLESLPTCNGGEEEVRSEEKETRGGEEGDG